MADTYLNIAGNPVKLIDKGDGTFVIAATLTGRLLRKIQVGTDQDVVFANSAAANTQVSLTITQPASPLDEYELIVYNPSTVTDLTCKVFTVETALGGGDRDSYLTAFSVPKSQSVTGTTINTYIRQLHGVFNGGNLKLVFSNDTVLGAAEGFTAKARLRELV